MRSSWITAIGLAAGAFTAASWLPQVIKTLRSRSAGDFAWGYLVFFSLGVMTWELYGLLTGDVAVIAANAVTIVLIMVVVWVKARE